MDLQLILLIDLDQDMLVLLMPLKEACLHMHADHDHGILHTDQSGTTPTHVLPLTEACSFVFKLMVTSLSVRLISAPCDSIAMPTLQWKALCNHEVN